MKHLSKLSDEELVVLYSEGNNKAFDILLTRYKNRIYSYIFYTVKDNDLTEDIFQETFVKVITTIKQGRYIEAGKFSSWVTRIAHNLIIDHYRQERNENLVSNDDSEEKDIFNRKELSEGTIEDSLITRQIHADIRRLVAAARQPTRGTHHALLQKHEFQRNCRRYAGKHQHGIGSYALRPAQHQKNGRRPPNTTFFLKKQTAYILNTHGLTF